MNLLLIIAALTGIATSALAQPRDSSQTRQRPAQPATARQNAYDTYRSTGEIVGSGAYSMVNTIDNRYEGLRGTPYLFSGWNKGQIELGNVQTYTGVPIKFNAQLQRVVMQRPWANNDSIILDIQDVKRFLLTDNAGQSYLFERLPAVKTEDPALQDSYFMVLYRGKTALLKRVSKVFKKADFKDPYSNNIRYDSFEDRFSYYLLKPDLSLLKVKLSKKALLTVLSDQADALSSYADTMKLTFKTEADAIALVKAYDAL